MSSSFYTRGGDDGFTGLLGQGRYPKEDPRLEALGAVDEASAALGLARAAARWAGAPDVVVQVQRDLYGVMAELAATPQNAERFRSVDGGRVAWLEAQVDALSAQTDVPNEFVVPGDSLEGALVDVARTVVRRAERRVAGLFHQQAVDNLDLLRYLNRLSSFCFVWGLMETRLAQQAAGSGDAKLTLARKKIQ